MELDEFIELVKEQQGIDLSGVLTTADKIDRPERALERQAIDDFMKRNPMAGGGMLVQPSADGSRPGYATSTVKLNNSNTQSQINLELSTSDKAPPKVKSKYDNLTPEMKDFYKKTTGKTWNKKDWILELSKTKYKCKRKKSKVSKESKMSPFYKKIGFLKQLKTTCVLKVRNLN